MKRYFILAVCAAAVLQSACSGESAFPEATGDSNVRAINTIPTAPAFSFLIEERFIGNVEFATASITNAYDDLDYTFNFEVALAGNTTRTRVASQFLDVVRDKDYTFVISGNIATPTIALWESDRRTWEGDETVFEVRFAHAASSLGDIDVYFSEATDPPTAPVPGAAQGTLAFGEFVPAADFAGGEYILTVTPAGDETTILYQSDPFTPRNATSIVMTVFDSDASDLTPVTVSLVNATDGGSSRLLDSRSQPTLRFFHASIDAGNTDIYVEDPLVTPRVSDHAFKDVTVDFAVPAGDVPLTYTAAGGTGSVLIDVDQPIVAGFRYHVYLLRTSEGEDAVVVSPTDRRAVETLSKLSIANTSTNNPRVDVYIVEADADIEELLPLIVNLPLGTFPASVALTPDSYDIYITVPSEKDVIVGPVRADLVGGDVFDVLIYDNLEPTTVDLELIAPP